MSLLRKRSKRRRERERRDRLWLRVHRPNSGAIRRLPKSRRIIGNFLGFERRDGFWADWL